LRGRRRRRGRRGGRRRRRGETVRELGKKKTKNKNKKRSGEGKRRRENGDWQRGSGRTKTRERRSGGEGGGEVGDTMDASRGVGGMYVKVLTPPDVNKNTSWFQYPGVWTTYILIIFISWLLILSVFGCDAGTAWTVVNLGHFAVSPTAPSTPRPADLEEGRAFFFFFFFFFFFTLFSFSFQGNLEVWRPCEYRFRIQQGVCSTVLYAFSNNVANTSYEDPCSPCKLCINNFQTSYYQRHWLN